LPSATSPCWITEIVGLDGLEASSLKIGFDWTSKNGSTAALCPIQSPLMPVNPERSQGADFPFLGIEKFTGILQRIV
jgi:hypothetical protein